MAETSKAVFLSYASQDAEPARRLCEALQSAGLEVWFDQSELRGGDAWDASIRKRIKDCALFVPIVSANTNARSEGYFRLEWKLAVDRSHLISDDQAFLLPVAIDATAEADARVPDRFREMQWSRMSGAESVKAITERVRRLLAGAAPSGAPQGAGQAKAAAPSGGTPSIAVLPFVNMSRDEENEYFADGLSEELLNVLAKIRGLRVASRTSAFFFKGKTIDIPTVAQKLNVETILEGSVRKAGKRVRITAQLIQVATDSHLWSQTYDRELDDIFAVQDDIAQSVVTELRSALLGEGYGAAANAAKAEVKAVATGRADNAEAQRLYMQGQFFLERMTQADVERGVDFFRQAVELDPEFALGWCGLSRAYWTQAGYGWRAVGEGFEAARTAAQRALAIAPDLAEGHVRLGHVLQGYDWDWKGASAAFQRAFDLAPGNAEVLCAYATQKGMLGDKEEAMEMFRRSVALDPLSASAHRSLGLHCAIYGEHEAAGEAFRAALDLNPTSGLANAFLSIVRVWQGRPVEARQLAEREALPDFRLFAIAVAEQALGHVGESDAALATMIERHGDTMAYQIAEICAWRGETDGAFEWLERAYAQRDPGLNHTLRDPFFNPLRNDARWEPFLKKMGFAE